MEGDCKEGSSSKMIKNDEDPKITQLFTILSKQITQLSSQNITIQDQLRDNEHTISTKFRMVVQENESFKQSMRSELDELHNLILSQSQPISPSRQATSVSSSSSKMNSGASSNNGSQSPPPISGITTIVSPSVLISSDPQANMLLMLAESFTKLTSVLSDKSDLKSSDWPKFSGDQKKFRAWCLSILSQISILPWKELYDSSKNDIVTSTSNVSLNEKLYAKLGVSLEGQVLQDIITRSHLRANGILLLQELVQTYRPKHVPEVFAAKAGEFWSQTKRLPTESVGSYYNRFQELLDELSHADDQISTNSAMHHFFYIRVRV
jgi:hypothetical protein